MMGPLESSDDGLGGALVIKKIQSEKRPPSKLQVDIKPLPSLPFAKFALPSSTWTWNIEDEPEVTGDAVPARSKSSLDFKNPRHLFLKSDFEESPQTVPIVIYENASGADPNDPIAESKKKDEGLERPVSVIIDGILFELFCVES